MDEKDDDPWGSDEGSSKSMDAMPSSVVGEWWDNSSFNTSPVAVTTSKPTPKAAPVVSKLRDVTHAKTKLAPTTTAGGTTPKPGAGPSKSRGSVTSSLRMDVKPPARVHRVAAQVCVCKCTHSTCVCVYIYTHIFKSNIYR
jgi:hypothetical protein